MTLAMRSPFALALGRCLRVATLPTLAAALVGAAMSRWFAAPIESVERSPAALSPWLQLPVFTAAALCAFAAAFFWPVFAARRPGADHVLRIQRGQLRGTGAVVAGAMVAQFVLTTPLVVALSHWLGAPSTARARVLVTPPADPLLDGVGERLVIRLPEPIVASAIDLRPLAAPPRGAMVPTTLEVFGDDERLAPANGEPAPAVDQTGRILRVAFPPRRIASLRITQTAGNVPVVFVDGSIAVVAAETRASTWNAVLAALLGLVPTFTALAVAAACGSRAALPTVACVIGGVLFVQTFAGAGAADDAMRAVLRGHWLPATGVFLQSVPSLAAGSLAMIVRMVLSRQRPR